MLLRLVNIFLALIVLVGCAGNEPPPQGILSETQMIDVLVDIHLAEGIKQANETTLDRTHLQIGDMYQAVFDHYNLTEEEFRKSYDWYSRREVLFDKVYEKVIERLNSMIPGGKGTPEMETEVDY